MAQLLLQGTNFVNFLGRYAYVGEGSHGFEAVAVAEHDEPQAVIGSYLQKLAYPENYARHQKTKELTESHEHGGNVLSLQLRGEYLYAAKGRGGVEITTWQTSITRASPSGWSARPVSPVGQKFYVKTKDARWIASPTTLGVDPARRRNPENEEQPIHPLVRLPLRRRCAGRTDPDQRRDAARWRPAQQLLKRALAFQSGRHTSMERTLS